MEPHLLSVQSHVARDYVGNRAGSLALQLLGHEVDIINTVNFSSMYVHEGNILSGPDFDAIMGGLFKAIAQPKGAGQVGAAAEGVVTDVHDLPVVASGYIADVGVLKRLMEVVKRLKSTPCGCSVADRLRRLKGLGCTDSCLYMMDPVMGDNGHLYVSQEMIDGFRKAACLADIITPNEYELEWLVQCERSPTSSPKPTVADVLQKVRECHKMGPFFVLLTSVNLAEVDDSRLVAIASVKRLNSSAPITIVITFDKLDCYLGGCGDVTSAVLIDRLMSCDVAGDHQSVAEQLKEVVGDTINTLQTLIRANPSGAPSIQLVKNVQMLRKSTQDAAVRSMCITEEDCLEAIIKFVRQ